MQFRVKDVAKERKEILPANRKVLATIGGELVRAPISLARMITLTTQTLRVKEKGNRKAKARRETKARVRARKEIKVRAKAKGKPMKPEIPRPPAGVVNQWAEIRNKAHGQSRHLE